MPTLAQAISTHPDANVFRRVRANGSDHRQWEFVPQAGEILSPDEAEGYYVIRAMNIVSASDVRPCYMDVSLPERINDYAYIIEGDGGLRYDYPHKFSGHFIPAIAIDAPGLYELFYSRIAPELGIGVLQRGLSAAANKACIAEDLGYIFRDEGRYLDAAEMFQLAAEAGPSSYFIYGELAEAYRRIGETDKALKYAERFKRGAE